VRIEILKDVWVIEEKFADAVGLQSGCCFHSAKYCSVPRTAKMTDSTSWSVSFGDRGRKLRWEIHRVLQASCGIAEGFAVVAERGNDSRPDPLTE
jgi:hypothetical protein